MSAGAVLAQKNEDGRINPVQFVSRIMNYVERGYDTCVREALDVIFSLKKFRVYLLSSQAFMLLTDHEALSYEYIKKYVHRRLTRWMDFMVE